MILIRQLITVAVIVSHVEYSNGYRNNLKALSKITHEHDALLVVDVYQSAGALNIDVKQEGIDFLTSLLQCGRGA